MTALLNRLSIHGIPFSSAKVHIIADMCKKTDLRAYLYLGGVVDHLDRESVSERLLGG